MAIKWIFFDLDGTLLPMDQDEFVKAYFGTIAAKMAPFGYEPEKLIKGIWKGTEAMIRNDGKVTNEKAFWNCFSEMFGCDSEVEIPRFQTYYETDFDCACAIVLGSEGNGVSRIVKENSDFIVSIPMYGKVNSLNVSTAASVILCHAARMQRGGK